MLAKSIVAAALFLASWAAITRTAPKHRATLSNSFATAFSASLSSFAPDMYLYENLEKHVPIAQTLDAASNLRAQDRMKQLATSPRLIVPGHDPAAFEKFPKVSERVVRIE